ncbi:MAG: hypothetical protein WA825_12975 [Steroidobacteraceae bacterium]
MSDLGSLQSLASRIRLAGGLGRSRHIRRLFDFLLECSTTGRSPKETEVAIEVFGKDTGFDVAQDPMVRVYVYKLRRKLEKFYSGPGQGDFLQLVIPRGVYRIVIQDRRVGALGDPSELSAPASGAGIIAMLKASAARAPRRWILPVFIASLLFNVILAGGLVWHSRRAAPANPMRASSVWSRLLDSRRPLCVVLGDYYIFAETDRNMEVQRLVREFSINSASDLDQYLRLHPKFADRYQEMHLNYLPTSAAYALQELLPLTVEANPRIRVVMASELTSEMLKSSDIIYIGYLSGMGMLNDLVFRGSRFEIGDSFDVLVDRTSRKQYISQAVLPEPGEQTYHDVGYFATFAGPSNNQIMIVAGTRDVAVRRVADSITHADTLQQLMARSGNQRSFEALYDVFAMNGTDLNGTLLLTGRIDTTRIWTDEALAPAAALRHPLAATATHVP